MRLSLRVSLALFLLGLAACHSASSSGNRYEAEVRTFLDHYFSSGSAQGAGDRGSYFSKQGYVTSIDSQDKVKVDSVSDFLHNERSAHQQSSESVVEKPTDIKVQGDDRVQQAAVTWSRKSGSSESHGADFFTVVHDDKEWKIVSLVAVPSASPAGSGGTDADARTFLEHYFATWSAQDMDGYGHCFADQARIMYIEGNAQVNASGTIDFLHGQRLSHQESAERMTEAPLEMKIQGDDRTKQAAVTWLLKKGSTETRGTDFFTLQHDASGWKIVSLVFYGNY